MDVASGVIGAGWIALLALAGAYLGAWLALRGRLPPGVMPDRQREASRSRPGLLVLDEDTAEALAVARGVRRAHPELRIVGGDER